MNPRTVIFLVVVAAITQSCIADAECNVVPIETWGGRPSNRTTDLSRPVKIAVVQHTVTKECLTDGECQRIAKNIRDVLINMGYDDIGQSFIIGGNGKVYEGAGWKVGAHTRGWNDRAIGISFIGDFREKLPTPQALKAAEDFLACSVSNENLAEDYHLVGHLQLSATLSPGATLQSHIETWPHWLSDVSKLLN